MLAGGFQSCAEYSHVNVIEFDGNLYSHSDISKSLPLLHLGRSLDWYLGLLQHQLSPAASHIPIYQLILVKIMYVFLVLHEKLPSNGMVTGHTSTNAFGRSIPKLLVCTALLRLQMRKPINIFTNHSNWSAQTMSVRLCKVGCYYWSSSEGNGDITCLMRVCLSSV